MPSLRVFFILFLLLSIESHAQQPDKMVADSISLRQALHQGKSIDRYYAANSGNSVESESIGSVGKGSLKNGKLMPFIGANYSYFDTLSYFEGRAFTHSKVKDVILEAYDSLAKLNDRHYKLMELSNEEGGKMFPHHTHQNGMSVDFMMPLVQHGKPYYDLDDTGADHYLLKFDDDGLYSEDKSVSVDFDLIAQHILILEHFARSKGYKISKVIIKIEFKDELFATPYGKQLKASDVYVVQKLTPLVNSLHDEHYHIDFAKL